MASEPIGGLHIQLSAETAKLIQDLGKARSSINRFSRDASKGVQGLQRSFQSLGQVATALSGLAIFGTITKGFQGAIRAAVSFESAFIGVRKTVDLSEEGFARLQARFEELSTTTGVAFEELSKIGEIAGQLGVKGVDNLSKFTDTISRITVSSNLGAEAAATGLAQFANVAQISIEHVDRLAASIVALGNEFETNESDILDISQRLAASGAAIGLTASEILGFGAALRAVGLEAESGGTAFQKVFIKIAQAASQGDRAIAEFTENTVEGFRELVRTNPAEAVLQFVETLGRVKQEGGNIFAILDQFDIKSERLVTALLSAANAGDKVRQSILKSGESFQEGTAHIVESEKRFQSIEFAMLRVGRAFDIFKKNIGNVITPSITELSNLLIPLLLRVSELAQQFPNLTRALVAMAGVVAVGGVLLVGLAAFALLMGTLGASSGPILAVAGVIVTLTGVFVGLKNEIPGLNDLLDRLKNTLKSLLELDFESFNRHMKAILGGDFTDEARLATLKQQREILTRHIQDMQESLAKGGDKAFFGFLDTGLEAKINAAKKELANLDKEIQAIIDSQKPKVEAIAKAEPVAEVRRGLGVGGDVAKGLTSASSDELQKAIALREAKVRVAEADRERLEFLGKLDEEQEAATRNRIRDLKHEIILYESALAIQKERERIAKEADVDPSTVAVPETVVETAQLDAQAKITQLTKEDEETHKRIIGLKEEEKGADIAHTATITNLLRVRDATKKLEEELFQLQLASLDPLKNEDRIRARQIQVIDAEILLLKERQEVLGENHKKELQILEARKKSIQATFEPTQPEIGQAIVERSSKEFEAKVKDRLKPFIDQVNEAQLQVDLGERLPNQLPETNRLRRIELIEKTIALLSQERQLNLISQQEFSREFLLLDADLRRETAVTQQSFGEGWRQAFQQFTQDNTGAFGLGQVVARNFATGVQTLLSTNIAAAFDDLESKTRSWNDALGRIKDSFKQLVAQMISAVAVQAALSAIGGGPGFGAAAVGAGGGNSFTQGLGGLRGFGAASGADFMVGGRGGIDANFLPMHVTKGERVIIETPAQQRNSRGGDVIVNVQNTSSLAQARASHRTMPGGQKTINVIVEDIVEDSMRHGRLGHTMSKTFGVGRTGRTG